MSAKYTVKRGHPFVFWASEPVGRVEFVNDGKREISVIVGWKDPRNPKDGLRVQIFDKRAALEEKPPERGGTE